jgi:hypothetical protein
VFDPLRDPCAYPGNLTIHKLTELIQQMHEAEPWRSWVKHVELHISTCLPPEQPCLVANLTMHRDPFGMHSHNIFTHERSVIMTQHFFDHCQHVMGAIDKKELAAWIVWKLEGARR